ncbi:unnamed protein product [Auanema sp. JU1783]|nr:unnamed protein product [Auanema sp. JU1783]
MLSPTEDDLLTIEDHRIELEKEIASLKNQLKHSQEKNEKHVDTNANLSVQLRKFQKEVDGLRAENYKLRAERWNDIKHILKENQDLSIEVEDVTTLFQQLTSTNQNLWERYDEMDSKVMELEGKCHILRKENKEVNRENKALEDLNASVIQENSMLQNKIKQLKDRNRRPIVVDNDGFPTDSRLMELDYYYGNISREEAQNILSQGSEGSFLIRNCKMTVKDYTVSVKSGKHVRHFLIRTQGSRLFISTNVFENWDALLTYYTKKPLQQSGSRLVRLGQPYTLKLSIVI